MINSKINSSQMFWIQIYSHWVFQYNNLNKYTYCKLSISDAPNFPNCCSKDFSIFNVDNFNKTPCTWDPMLAQDCSSRSFLLS